MFRVFFAVMCAVSVVAMFLLPPAAWLTIIWAAGSIGFAHLGGWAGAVILGALAAWLGAAPCMFIFMMCLIWAKLFAELADA